MNFSEKMRIMIILRSVKSRGFTFSVEDTLLEKASQNLVNARSSVLKLRHPLGNTCSGQKIYPI